MKFPIEIIVAVIGLSGILIPILYQSYNSFFLEKPFLDITIKPKNDTAEIKIKNIGFSYANNIELFIYSEEIINRIINTFSTVDVSLIDLHKNITKVLNLNESVPVNDRFLKLEIPELKQGGGSFVTLMTIGNETLIPKDNEDKYQVYATFKQGSIRGELEKNLLNKQISAMSNFLTDIASNLYFLIPFYVIYILFFIPYFVYYRKRIHKFHKHIDNIIDDVIRFINFYKDEAFELTNTFKEVINGNTFGLSKYREGVEVEREYKDIRNMLSVKDLSLIHKFNNKIQNRNSLYEKYKTDSYEDKENTKKQIKMANDDCVKYANKILKEVSWSDYKSSGISFVTTWRIIYENFKRERKFQIGVIYVIIFTIIIFYLIYVSTK